MTDTLKPCPFCGGKAKCIEFYGMFHVICCDCYIAGGDRPSIDGAIEAWNARPIEDDAVNYEPTSYSCRACKNSTDSEIKRLQEALKEINKMIKDAEEAVYIFPVDLDSEYKAHILEVLEEALKNGDIQ